MELCFQPELTTREPINVKQLPEMATELLSEKTKLKENNRAAFSLQMRFPSPEPDSLRQLSREERLLGLFKIWLS